MKNAAVLIALATMLAPTGLRAADYCDDKMEPGESVDGKIMATIGAIQSFALAERYCGAPPTALSHILVIVEESFGCGPRARLEAKYKKLDEEPGATTADWTIRDLLGVEKDVPQAEVDRRAKASIKADWGGCSGLLKLRQDLENGRINPPK